VTFAIFSHPRVFNANARSEGVPLTILLTIMGLDKTDAPTIRLDTILALEDRTDIQTEKP